METKLLIGLIIALLILAFLVYLASTSSNLFKLMVDWFKGILGL